MREVKYSLKTLVYNKKDPLALKILKSSPNSWGDFTHTSSDLGQGIRETF